MHHLPIPDLANNRIPKYTCIPRIYLSLQNQPSKIRMCIFNGEGGFLHWNRSRVDESKQTPWFMAIKKVSASLCGCKEQEQNPVLTVSQMLVIQ